MTAICKKLNKKQINLKDDFDRPLKYVFELIYKQNISLFIKALGRNRPETA